MVLLIVEDDVILELKSSRNIVLSCKTEIDTAASLLANSSTAFK